MRRKVYYDPACDWYVEIGLEPVEGGAKDAMRVTKRKTMDYYYGKTTIPKVKRKKGLTK